MPLFLSGLINIFGSGLPALFASFTAHWKIWLIALLSLLSVGSCYEWHHTSTLLKTEKAAHAADIKSYKTASADAQKKADTEKAQLTQTAKEQAHVADQDYSNTIAKYRANLLRYQATQSVRSGPNSGQSSNPPEVVNGPSSGADVSPTIQITSDDANICAVNTARLQSAHDWALQYESKPNGSDADPQSK